MNTRILSYHILKSSAKKKATRLNAKVAGRDDGSVWTRYHIRRSDRKILRYYIYVEKHRKHDYAHLGGIASEPASW